MRGARIRCALFALLAAVCSAEAAPTISISPASPLADQRLEIRITGVAPSRPVTIESDTRAGDGLHWRASAVFVADANGAVDLGARKPVSGSYSTADAMGLFWSALPAGGPPDADRAFFAVTDYSKPLITVLRVHGGQSVTVTRRFASPDVVAIPMGKVGMLFTPKDGRAHPGILVIGGSDGGLGAPGTAMLLASHGYAALSAAYFGAPGLPATLENIPMERFANALAWLRQRCEVDSRAIAIYGESRGTEPALWIAAHDPGVRAVVARSPSFALWGGVSASHLPGDAAWTWRGENLPYIANHITLGFAAHYLWSRATGTPVRQSDLFLSNLADYAPTNSQEIAVDHIRSPVLLLAGKDDAVWPSWLMAQLVASRMKRFHHAFADELVGYDNVGHPIPYAYTPTGGERDGLTFAVGGTPEGTARAQADAWPRILSFLTKSLGLAKSLIPSPVKFAR